MNTENLHEPSYKEMLCLGTKNIAVLLAVKKRRNMDPTFVFMLSLSHSQGQDILKAFGWFLRLFGIETGL